MSLDEYHEKMRGTRRYFRDYPMRELYRKAGVIGFPMAFLMSMMWPFLCYCEWVVEHESQ